MFKIFYEVNAFEVWHVCASSGHRTLMARHRFTVVEFLRAYSPQVHMGSSRGLAEHLDQDCLEYIDQPPRPWHNYTYEEAAQLFPGDMDNLVDSLITKGMQRPQIQLRLCLTVRRQLLTILRSIKEDMT